MGMAKNMQRSGDYALLYRWLANVYSQNDIGSYSGPYSQSNPTPFALGLP